MCGHGRSWRDHGAPQLLFTSKGQRPKDHVDAREVIPSLDPAGLDRLAAWLDPNHPWQELLTGR